MDVFISPDVRIKIREWLKVLRKKNVYVVFATQSIADAVNSDIAPAILENCLTRVFLPNARALEPSSKDHYEKLGLNNRQIQIVASGTPKRQYYYQSQNGCRLFDLALSDVELAFCGASNPADLLALDETRERYGIEGFAAAWLRYRKLNRAGRFGHGYGRTKRGQNNSNGCRCICSSSKSLGTTGGCVMNSTIRPWMATFLMVAMVGLPSRAFAFLGIGDVVHDPTTFIQTMKTAMNTAAQLKQQIDSTKHLFEQLKYAKMNAESLDPTSLADLQGGYYQMDALYRQSKYIGTQWGVVGQQFDTAYQKYDPKIHDNQTYEKKLKTWETQTDDSIRSAMKAHGVLDRYQSREIQLTKILNASRTAKGQLAAIQAGNEISALMMRQMMELTTLIITDSRARLSYMQEQRLTEDATKKHKKAKRMMEGYGKKENPAPQPKRTLTPIKE